MNEKFNIIDLTSGRNKYMCGSLHMLLLTLAIVCDS